MSENVGRLIEMKSDCDVEVDVLGRKERWGKSNQLLVFTAPSYEEEHASFYYYLPILNTC